MVICVLLVFKLEQNWLSYNADKMSALDTVANFLLKHILLTWIFLDNSHLYFSYHSGCYVFIHFVGSSSYIKGVKNLLYPLRFSFRALQIKLAKDQFTGGKANRFIF